MTYPRFKSQPISGLCTFGSLTPFDTTIPKNYVVKFDNSGNPTAIWYVGGGPNSGATCKGVSVAYSTISNSVYVVGQFSGTIQTVDGINIVAKTSTGKNDIFVQKFTTSLGYNALTGFVQYGGTNPTTHILTPIKAVCNQYTVGSTTKATLSIAANYSGSGIVLNSVSLLGNTGGMVLTLDDISATSTPAFKNLFPLQDTPLTSITKNFAVGNNTIIDPIFFTNTIKVSMINFTNDGLLNWKTYSSSSNSLAGNSVYGFTVAKSINKVYVTGSISGTVNITFGSTTLNNLLRTFPYIWQYYDCL